jgi:hypothetical protein
MGRFFGWRESGRFLKKTAQNRLFNLGLWQ